LRSARPDACICCRLGCSSLASNDGAPTLS
jgi:hypothetical protein